MTLDSTSWTNLYEYGPVTATLLHYPEARRHIGELCWQAQKWFSRVTTSTYNLSDSAGTVFSFGERRRRKRGQPLRLDCVAITAYVKGGKAEVRVQAYIENELRRDTSRYFTSTQERGGTW